MAILPLAIPSYNPIRKLITTSLIIFGAVWFYLPFALSTNRAYAAELDQGPQEFGIDYNIYKNRAMVSETRRLLRLKQEEKLTAQKLAEAEAQAAERKNARIAQAHRGELRELPTTEYRIVQTLTGNFSAYTPSPDECSGNPWITASGKRVHYGTIAAPPAYPFGTMLRLPDYDPDTIFIVEDRGGAIKGNKFDLWLPDKPSAFAFGRRNLKVEIIELVDNRTQLLNI